MDKAYRKSAKILIVDDEEANVLLLERILEIGGLPHCKGVTDSRLAIETFEEFEPDIILLDLAMPHLDGFELLQKFSEYIPEDCYLPILVLTADMTERAKQRALSSGAHDFITKPFDNAEVILRVSNLLRTRRLHLQTQLQNENLEATVSERTVELRQALTELHTAQAQMIQQERLHALGMMASGVAHDFNNALSIIMGFGELVLRDCQNNPETQKAVEHMRLVLTAADDASNIVGRLREFNRPQGVEIRRSVNLSTIVEQALNLTRPRWQSQAMAKGVTIRPQLDLHKTSPVKADPAELREVLTNLIFNAVDAMPEGGTLSCGVHEEPEWVVLEVSDTGTGMPEEVRCRCLEPFFTTKGERGTGLGLAMVYGIVQRHHGTMDIRSEPGRGTTFSIRIPPKASVSECGENVVDHIDSPMRVLIVDDQELLREIFAQYLIADLHSVEMAADAAAALSQMENKEFDIVITDQAMPGMTGDQLAVVIKERYPHVRIILLSGFCSTENEAKPNGIDLVVGKPITQRELRQAVSKLAKSD